MPRTSLTKPELQILEVLWTRGACSIREIHEALPARGRPAFTTIQTVVYRLEKKHALRCVKRISNANIVAAVDLPRRGACHAGRRAAQPVWRPSETGDGAAGRNGPLDARRHQGSRRRAEEAAEERRVAMTPWVPSALINHLWQSTLFVVASGWRRWRCARTPRGCGAGCGRRRRSSSWCRSRCW